VQRTRQRMKGACALRAACATSPSNQALFFVMLLEVSHYYLPVEVALV